MLKMKYALIALFATMSWTALADSNNSVSYVPSISGSWGAASGEVKTYGTAYGDTTDAWGNATLGSRQVTNYNDGTMQNVIDVLVGHSWDSTGPGRSSGYGDSGYFAKYQQQYGTFGPCGGGCPTGTGGPTTAQ